jgi:hypothetical protein
MAGVKIVLNSGDMGKLLKSEQMRPALRAIAEGWAARARATAPVDTGAYRDSIQVVDDTTDRAVARVVAQDRKAPIVEYRTGNLKRAMGR